jgi:hypothetical protein
VILTSRPASAGLFLAPKPDQVRRSEAPVKHRDKRLGFERENLQNYEHNTETESKRPVSRNVTHAAGRSTRRTRLPTEPAASGSLNQKDRIHDCFFNDGRPTGQIVFNETLLGGDPNTRLKARALPDKPNPNHKDKTRRYPCHKRLATRVPERPVPLEPPARKHVFTVAAGADRRPQFVTDISSE